MECEYCGTKGYDKEDFRYCDAMGANLCPECAMTAEDMGFEVD